MKLRQIYRMLLRAALREGTEAGLSPVEVVRLLRSLIDNERAVKHVAKRA